MTRTPLIQIESISKHFGSHDDGVTALRHVSLTVGEGEFISLIGPSGCGKTTLLKIVADLLSPSSGRVTINSLSPREARRAHETALVFQSPTLMEWRTIARNIELPLEIMGHPRPQRAARTHDLLQMVRLSDFAARYPHELSAGMQQQIAIARALAYGPKILLMDEPFGALDEITRERLGQALLEIWERERVTVLFVTHSISEAVWLADRVAVFTPRPGRIAQTVDIDLPRPRRSELRESPRYLELVQTVRRALRMNGNELIAFDSTELQTRNEPDPFLSSFVH